MIEIVAAIAMQTAPLPCLRPVDRISGELRIVESKHPNGTALKSYFVVLPNKRCVENEEFGRVDGRWVQLTGNASQQVASLPLGSSVTIEAEVWMISHTAWHLGDFVALNARMVGYELQ